MELVSTLPAPAAARITTFKPGALVRFTEPVYTHPAGTIGLVYQLVQQDTIDDCAILLEDGTDIGFMAQSELSYCAEIVLQLKSTYAFISPEVLMQDFQKGVFRSAFSFVPAKTNAETPAG